MIHHHSHFKLNKFVKVAPPQKNTKITFAILCLGCVVTLAITLTFQKKYTSYDPSAEIMTNLSQNKIVMSPPIVVKPMI
jgi:hypothetical protein